MIGGRDMVALTTSTDVLLVAAGVVFFVVCLAVATRLGRRSGRQAISQRLTALGSRLGLDPPEDESNVETALAYLEQVTGGAAQAVAESSSDAIRLRRSLDTLTQGVVLCDENGTVIYRNGRANALMVSRHGDLSQRSRQRAHDQPPRRRIGGAGGDRTPGGRLARRDR